MNSVNLVSKLFTILGHERKRFPQMLGWKLADGRFSLDMEFEERSCDEEAREDITLQNEMIATLVVLRIEFGVSQRAPL